MSNVGNVGKKFRNLSDILWRDYLVPVIVLSFLSVFMNGIFSHIFVNDFGDFYATHRYEANWQIVYTVLVAPLIEELIFRLFVYNVLRRLLKKFRYGILSSIIISSVLFGVFHLKPVQGFYAFLLGLVLAYMYENTRRIDTPFIMHIGANAFSVILTVKGVSITVSIIIFSAFIGFGFLLYYIRQYNRVKFF